ncbi:hypothetical protein [Candidatus Enterococcus leclercqii]|uniref:hypothetical protein n=1 Tax=Candidatus Enterococcus leclercqii TaxID=1857218 RepID=UPI001379E39D|nr:hypothetical protein [Enterococcus sp. CU9D]KAF1294227.1 hypothetical protein BAU14_07515 [Enterococcus sp. CU9D]
MPAVFTVHALIDHIEKEEITKKIEVRTIRDVLTALEGCNPSMSLSWLSTTNGRIGGVHRECLTFQESEAGQRHPIAYAAVEAAEYLGPDHAYISEFLDLVKWNIEADQEDSARLSVFIMNDLLQFVKAVWLFGEGSEAQPVLILDRMGVVL